MGRPTYSSTPAVTIGADPIRGKIPDLGTFKPARCKIPSNTNTPTAIIPKITENISSQVSGEEHTGITPISSASTRSKSLRRCGSLPSVSFGRRGLSFDPVATATSMWAEVDAENQNKAEDGASEAGRGEDSIRHEPNSCSVMVKAEIHRADNVGTGDDDFVTAQEAQVPSNDGTEERHPQNYLIVDMSEKEVQLGKKVVEGGSETKESTMVSDSLVNSIESWQKAKISNPMGYRCNTDTYDSDNEPDDDEQRSDRDSNFGLFD